MSTTCNADPVACIDFVALFVGEFLKDWTTLAMLATLLILLLRKRAEQERAREEEYARQLLAHVERKAHDARHGKTWNLDEKPE